MSGSGELLRLKCFLGVWTCEPIYLSAKPHCTQNYPVRNDETGIIVSQKTLRGVVCWHDIGITELNSGAFMISSQKASCVWCVVSRWNSAKNRKQVSPGAPASVSRADHEERKL